MTPEGRSAFENDHCPKCGHENERKDLFCVKCDEQLPKPAVSKNGKLRIIRGFTSAYKRMYWDKPGSTVTTRSAYACSDHKVHPSQDGVLSTFEVATLQGIDVNRYNWARDEEECVADDTLLRDIIGECVPPLFAEIVGRHIIEIEAGTVEVQPHQQLLFR